jgi:peptidoglycan biosynthesis protein MviN/MurJ (putative lipid II flippase)
MNNLIFSLSIIAQLFSLIFAPYIILIFFQRGALNHQDLQLIQIIFQILSIGFVPGLMFGFLSKVMFIEGENVWMLKMTIVKTVIELLLMYTFIFQIQHGIPIALTLSKFLFTITILVYLNIKHPGILNHKRFFWIYGGTLLVSILVIYINDKILSDSGINKSPIFHFSYIFAMLTFLLGSMLFLVKIHPEIRSLFSNINFTRIKKN